MYILGVTGGVGSGKSKILEYLEQEKHAVVVRSDELGRVLLDPGTPGFDRAVEIFGSGVVREDGTLDRAAIAAELFRYENKKEALDAYIHPAVIGETRRVALEAQKRGESLFVVESAILFVDSYNEMCDGIWYIYADIEKRRARLRESRGYSDERTDSMIRNQMSEEEYRRRCDLVIDNSGDFTDTQRQIDEALSSLK